MKFPPKITYHVTLMKFGPGQDSETDAPREVVEKIIEVSLDKTIKVIYESD